MEVFSVFGISNAEILAAAAVVFALALTISLALRAFRPAASDVEGRLERLEIRLAAATAVQPIIAQADELGRQVSQNAIAPVIEMFEDAPRPRAFFSAGPAPEELAAALATDLRDNVEVAAAIARPIRNMIDNGSMEVGAERSRLAADIRTRAAALGSQTWSFYGRALLASGVPSRSAEAVFTCFARVRTLRSAINAMERKPSADQLVEVLAAAASLVEAADQANSVFAGVPEPAEQIQQAVEPDASAAA